jgi:hypothetical protein
VLLRSIAAGVYWLLTNSSYVRVRELRRRNRKRPRGTASWFSDEEAALVDVLASLIVPSDETSPGAREAEVVDTLDRMVVASPKRRELYWLGLYSFDEWARHQHGRSFLELPASVQLELLTEADQKQRKWGTSASLSGRIARNLVTFLHLAWRGVLPAIRLFPMLVADVQQAFYTSSVGWVWLGYDGPPMPHGYPDLSERHPRPETSEVTQDVAGPSRPGKKLKIVVCLKQVPSPGSRYKLDESAKRIREDQLVFVTNEGDLFALEEALRLRERVGGEILVLSLGERRVLKTLRDGLAMGADRALHLCDPGFQDADPFVAAKAMAAAIRREGADLVLTGVESTDYAEGQIAGILAQLLGWSHAAIVVAAPIPSVRRRTDTGRIRPRRRQVHRSPENRAGAVAPLEDFDLRGRVVCAEVHDVGRTGGTAQAEVADAAGG